MELTQNWNLALCDITEGFDDTSLELLTVPADRRWLCPSLFALSSLVAGRLFIFFRYLEMLMKVQ